ncbi:MAG: protoporphyrinogen oxidase [Candidatus Binataceae bacterium]|nr:protoporphyrinogen oxidase [Candidatus Binataceae bacterium]
MTQRVAVVGGGISGLAAAFHLRELATAREIPLEVTVLEASTRTGGALHTIVREGFVLEAGADSFISDKPEALDLAGKLGLEGDLMGTLEAHRRAFVIHRGKPVEVPRGFSLLAPALIAPILETPLFSLTGKLRILIEPFIKARRGGGDESLAGFVRRRLGQEALDRLVQPLAAGIYMGDPAMLSMQAAFARFVMLEREHGSLMRGMRALRRNPAGGAGGVRWNLFLSLRGGMASMVRAIEDRLGESIKLGAEAIDLARNGAGWRIVMRDNSEIEADAVVCAAPAYAAARLLREVDADLSRALASIEYVSSATVNLAYDAAAMPDLPDGFGVLVPAIERRRIAALSFSSLKFLNRAPTGKVLMRAFVGGALNPEIMRLSTEAMIDVVRDELREILGIRSAPLFTYAWRWPRSMPQYQVGHLERVAEIEQQAAAVNSFALAGAAYRGVGIPDCVRSGIRAAESVFSQLAAQG